MKTANRAVALISSISIIFGMQFAATSALGQTETLDQLFQELKTAEPDQWEGIEKQIFQELSKSGSAAMDLLLERGRDELREGNFDVAIMHFSALIDHAPEFAEGWNARATAWFAKERYGLSMVDIRQTLLLEPRHFRALMGLALILERLDRKKDALEIYKQVREIHPNRPEVEPAIERLGADLEGVAL
ncbi:tetratricopeptide repeat protein [Neptunicoccus cionae]|uniref:tetratricopeptide repeat protein n=1 Tax=Neptunicoccus cionae TaxID=2035344 RepID=UPI0025705311|nr:tetratricopeptide repeat protein [Amylibacter cionae]